MTIRKHVKVQPGGVIQIEDPDLPEGDAEVTIELAAEEPVYEDARVLFEEIAKISASVPEEEWDKLPSDLSINRSHYRYGWLLRDPSS